MLQTNSDNQETGANSIEIDTKYSNLNHEDFLKKYTIEVCSYEECIRKIGMEFFSNFENEDDHFIDNFDPDDYIFYYINCNLKANATFNLPDFATKWPFLVINGNVEIKGTLHYDYFIKGNITLDYQEYKLNSYKIVNGKSSVKYLEYSYAEDDEVLQKVMPQNISAPYFFSWFVNLDCFKFSNETVITYMIFKSDEEMEETLKKLKKNTVFGWHEAAYILKDELCRPVREYEHDEMFWKTKEILEMLKSNKSIFKKGFSIESWAIYKKAVAYFEDEKWEQCFLIMQEAIKISPSFNQANYISAQCLQETDAYVQAVKYYDKAIENKPINLPYEVIKYYENAAFCNLRIGASNKAKDYLNVAIEISNLNYLGFKTLGEIFILENKYSEAKNNIKKSLDLFETFTGTWLLGLIYYLEGNTKEADKYYKKAIKKNKAAQPYSEQKNINYFYELKTVDWETKSSTDIKEEVKDQAFWNDFFDKKMKEGANQMGFVQEFMGKIPEEYRTLEMCEAVSKRKDVGLYRDDIKYFYPIITKELLLKFFVGDFYPSFSDIPKRLLDKEVCLAHTAVYIPDVPESVLDYDICLHALACSYGLNFNSVPKVFLDEKMFITAIVGGSLSENNYVRYPKKKLTNENICKAIDMNINTFKNLCGVFVNQEVYDYAKNKYGNTEEFLKYEKEFSIKNKFDYNAFNEIWLCFFTENTIIEAIKAGSSIYLLPKNSIS